MCLWGSLALTTLTYPTRSSINNRLDYRPQFLVLLSHRQFIRIWTIGNRNQIQHGTETTRDRPGVRFNLELYHKRVSRVYQPHDQVFQPYCSHGSFLTRRCPPVSPITCHSQNSRPIIRLRLSTTVSGTIRTWRLGRTHQSNLAALLPLCQQILAQTNLRLHQKTLY